MPPSAFYKHSRGRTGYYIHYTCASKMSTAECYYIYHRLLHVTNPNIFMQLLQQTEECDSLHSLAHVRHTYGTYLMYHTHGEKIDYYRQAMLHYNVWTTQEVTKALPWKIWFKHTLGIHCPKY